MKKLILKVRKDETEKNPDYPYYIYLGDRYKASFKSKRKAQDFIRSLNSYLSDSIRSLFKVYKDCLSIYLDNYFIISDYDCNRVESILDSFLSELKYFHKDFGDGYESLKMNGYWRIINHVQDSVNYLCDMFKKMNKYNIASNLNSLKLLIDLSYTRAIDILEKNVIDTSYKKHVLKIIHKNKELRGIC